MRQFRFVLLCFSLLKTRIENCILASELNSTYSNMTEGVDVHQQILEEIAAPTEIWVSENNEPKYSKHFQLHY